MNFFLLNRELSFLLLACSAQKNELHNEKLKTLISLGINWNYLFKLTNKHGLLSLLNMFLSISNNLNIDADFLKKIQRESYINLHRNIALTTELLYILRLLREKDIDGICYKGPALSLMAYNYLGVRHFEDIDIFVRSPEQAYIGKEILLNHGYTLNDQLKNYKETHFQITQCEYQLKKLKQSIAVDLHWQVFQDFFSFPFLAKEAWNQLKSISIWNQEFKTFSPEDMLLILCAHGTKHWWSKLSYVTDIVWLVINNLSVENNVWNRIIQKAQRAKSMRMLLIGLNLANKLFGLTLPDIILEKIKVDKVVKLLCKKIIRRFNHDFDNHLPFLDYTTLMLQSRECWSTRLRFCLIGIFVPSLSDFQWINLPEPFFKFYYILRPLRIFMHALGL